MSINKIREVASARILKASIKNRPDLMSLKRKLAKRYGQKILLNSEILEIYKKQLSQGKIKRNLALEKILRKRAVRTLSGIASVAVLTKNYPCPGECAFCPSEKNMPKSYLSNEPAVMRAIVCGFDPFKQVQLRLKALEANGHEPTKIELIVIGGTWSVLPEKYKYWFIKECFRAANDYENKKLKIKDKKHKQKDIKILKLKLQSEQKKNEKAKYRVIGITLETRPDYINKQELIKMRELGATRVELGVQIIDDEVLEKNKRGHGVKEIVEATRLLKNYGFKVTYHIMPGLPGSSAKKDLAMFKKLFLDERFQPDQIKFYPTLVTRGSLLYKWWRRGLYKPYGDKILENLIVECKKSVPPYVRIIRLIRDIPGESIIAGNTVTNLRQMMQQKGVACRCIRCREAKDRKLKVSARGGSTFGGRNLKLEIIKYKASGGDEYFINYESKDGKVLFGFCRLRLPQDNKKQTTDKNAVETHDYASLLGAVLIRELHVYGELVSVGNKKIVQHAGLGKKLMQKAEQIARQNGYDKIAVIAGVGVRDYYRKLGYMLKDTYMVKPL